MACAHGVFVCVFSAVRIHDSCTICVGVPMACAHGSAHGLCPWCVCVCFRRFVSMIRVRVLDLCTCP